MLSFLKAIGLLPGDEPPAAIVNKAPWEDYPFDPIMRPLETSAGGRQLIRDFIAGHSRFSALLDDVIANDDALARIPFHTGDARSPRWVNEMFPCVDGAVLYSLLKAENPKLYVEIGSGNSTKFARRAVEDHGLRTKIISIDPMPRAEIDDLCDEIIRKPLENVSDFTPLMEADCVFFDGSHRSFQNTDVTVFFTEIVPALAPGCLYGIHDILLPYDYPTEWKDRLYNEQYMLMTYLLAGAAGDEVVFPTAYVCQSKTYWATVQDLFRTWDPDGTIARTGGAFWMRRNRAARPMTDGEGLPS